MLRELGFLALKRLYWWNFFDSNLLTNELLRELEFFNFEICKIKRISGEITSEENFSMKM